MLQQIFFYLIFFLSLGAVLLTGLLYCTAHAVEHTGKGTSQHFFDVERGPARKMTLPEKIMNGLVIVALVLLFVFMFILAWDFLVRRFSPEQLSNAATHLQNSIATLLPVLISGVIFFSTFCKEHQTFYPQDNRIQRYKLPRLCLISVACWAIAFTLGIWAQFEKGDPLQGSPTFAAMILLLIGTFLTSLYVTAVTIKFAFSSQPFDVVQLKNLGQHRHDTSWDLWACNYPGQQALASFHKHLVMELQKQTMRFEKTLRRRCRIHKAHRYQVFFSDSTHMHPSWYKRLSIVLWLLLMWFVFGIIPCGFCVVTNIPLLSLRLDTSSLVLGFSVLSLCVVFLLRTKSCRQIAVFYTYGSWGYYFIDATSHKTIYSFGEREFTLSQSKKWLRTIWSILTLFRIELIQSDTASCNDFLTKLEAAANINPGLQGEMMWIARRLCCRLSNLEHVTHTPEPVLSESAAQLCDAIWTDYTREHTDAFCAEDLIAATAKGI